ncbi:peptidoglycan-binding protein [Streptomyces sp. NPDC004065]|uniref:peptidoglycan-binding domain-containing protein n=1 Tax=Streptomyces sp. NPDC004065 TaxID=3364689 RepID=UPI003850EB36
MDNTPSCACGRRAADALRDTRSAEAAAAEDFDPLRIRPYVTFEAGTGEPADGGTGEPADGGTAEAVGGGTPEVGGGTAEAGDDGTPEVGGGTAEAAGSGEAAGTGTAEGAGTGTALAGPGLDAAPGPDPDAGDGTPVGAGAGPRAGTRAGDARRRRPVAVFAVSGAVVAVAAAAGFAGGLFSYHSPARDGAAPTGVRQGVPDGGTTNPPSASAPEAAASPSAAPQAESRSPSASPSTGPSPSASPSDASPSPSPSPTDGGRTAAPATPTGTAPTTPAAPTPTAPPVLRRGDRGPEVTELQQRLAQLNLYVGRSDGVYDSRVEGSVRTYQWARGIDADDPGVYGPATRARLEAETSQP